MPEPPRAELAALSRAVLAMTRHLAVRDVLQMVVDSARELIASEYAALGVPDGDGAFSQFYASGITAAQWRQIGPLPRAHGLLGVMMRDARPVRLADIRADPRFVGWPPHHPILRDFLGVPIVDDGEIKGAIYLANRRPTPGFTRDDEELLTVLAAHAAIALANAHHFERSRELALVDERTRLARDLHDAVSQKLFSLRLTAEAAAQLIASDPDAAADQIARVQQLAREASTQLRAVVGELRPPELTEDGLAAAFAKHVEVLRHAHGLAIELVAAGLGPLPNDVEEVALRVGQEALHNAIRHADATKIEVHLARADLNLVLEVHDDGRGFDPRTTDHRSSGSARSLGLASMRERAGAVHGHVTVSSAAGNGTTVRLEIPLPDARHG
jgi:signal transduction histidine kinase